MADDDIHNGRLIAMIGIAAVGPTEFVIFRIAQPPGHIQNKKPGLERAPGFFVGGRGLTLFRNVRAEHGLMERRRFSSAQRTAIGDWCFFGTKALFRLVLP